MNFFVFPIFFLSGALFPVDRLPGWLRPACYADPLTYGVDLLRGALTGVSVFPMWVDFTVLGGFCVAMVLLGSVLFSRLEVS